MVEMKIVARPWQPQDLIDDLQEIIDEESDNYLNTRRTTLCMARDYLEEHFAEQKWIPVTERLPEKCEPVLACFDFMGGKVVKASDRYGKNGLLWSGIPCGGKVTHWMPLPSAPKGE